MFSKVLRRTHMYLALFLTPWVLMYTASTFVMNHRAWFKELYAGPPKPAVLEREMTYEGSFPEGSTAKQMARQILQSLNLEGAYNANRRMKDDAVVIQRLDPITPRRLTFEPASRKLTIEKVPWESRGFLERMHRRRGYQFDSLADDAWAVSVDFFVVVMIFWVLSGLWMWWEMKLARRLGALFALGGAALFVLFLVAI
ncbi:PepSY-associated TM helix domain-containing protein [Paludibaculum fermentans]|uniref:PepSY-associated TM helix domain-containing protein n=1 Tax=Paludibaculum fermentans TaxID=1473598 RepID=A0A7S7SK49_PALFE|nr:PepSY-associated TM helix domain-containing protein [Paludibaculum fermentans]QOY87111.1 PepSY-associated TM helix domain-containing protein [Paludibaculum fermentans]